MTLIKKFDEIKLVVDHKLYIRFNEVWYFWVVEIVIKIFFSEGDERFDLKLWGGNEGFDDISKHLIIYFLD